jgi:hypothetical protein
MKPTEVDSMNRLRVEAARKAADYKELLQAAMPWLEMHRDQEARDLGQRVRECLRDSTVPCGVDSPDGGKTK